MARTVRPSIVRPTATTRPSATRAGKPVGTRRPVKSPPVGVLRNRILRPKP